MRYWLTVLSALAVTSVYAGRHVPYGANRPLYINTVDTLSFGERFSLKANMVDWLLLTPSLGVEYTLGNKNWSRWTIGVHGRYKPTESFGTLPYRSNMRDVRLDVRRYMHGSGARRSWFLGLYGVAGRHDVKLSGTAYWGSHLGVGVSAGLVMPLFGYGNGSSLDLELSTNVGLLWQKPESVAGTDGGAASAGTPSRYSMTWKPLLHVAVHDVLRVSLVYHFGPSVANRYKRRIEIDEQYRQYLIDQQMRQDSIRQARQVQRQVRRDSLARAHYEQRFERQHQALERGFVRDSTRQAHRHRKEALRVERLLHRDSLRVERLLRKDARRLERLLLKDSLDLERLMRRDSIRLERMEQKNQRRKKQ